MVDYFRFARQPSGVNIRSAHFGKLDDFQGESPGLNGSSTISSRPTRPPLITEREGHPQLAVCHLATPSAFSFRRTAPSTSPAINQFPARYALPANR